MPDTPHALTDPQPIPGFEHYKPARWIRVSALNDYLRCPRLYFYRYGCGLVPREVRLALHFGEAIHAALGWFLGHPGDLAGGLVAFDRVWKPEWEELRETKMGLSRNRDVAVKMLIHWLDTHSGSRSLWVPVPPPRFEGGLVPAETQSDYEIPFAVDIGLPILLVGRIDALSRHRDTGDLWLVEFKTGSEFSWNLLSGAFTNNTQALSYNLAMHLMGHNVRGTMVDLLLASKRRQDNQTVPIEIRPHTLEAHLRLIRWKIGELLEFERRRDFPQDFSGCNHYSTYGNPGFSCDFDRLCMVPDWTILKDIYQVQEDRPFHIPLEVLNHA